MSMVHLKRCALFSVIHSLNAMDIIYKKKKKNSLSMAERYAVFYFPDLWQKTKQKSFLGFYQ